MKSDALVVKEKLEKHTVSRVDSIPLNGSVNVMLLVKEDVRAIQGDVREVKEQLEKHTVSRVHSFWHANSAQTVGLHAYALIRIRASWRGMSY